MHCRHMQQSTQTSRTPSRCVTVVDHTDHYAGENHTDSMAREKTGVFGRLSLFWGFGDGRRRQRCQGAASIWFCQCTTSCIANSTCVCVNILFMLQLWEVSEPVSIVCCYNACNLVQNSQMPDMCKLGRSNLTVSKILS